MKVFFAPDTSDHPNWGCRIMGQRFREALVRSGTGPMWRTGSKWFMTPAGDAPSPTTLAQFRHYADEMRAGRILQDVANVLRQCDLVFLNGENFIRPGQRKGRMLLFLAYLAKTVFDKPCVLSNHSADLDEPELLEIAREVYPLLDEVHFREDTSAERYAQLVPEGRWRLIPDIAWAVPPAPVAQWGELGRREGHFCVWPDTASSFDPLRPYVTVAASSVHALPQHRGLNPVPAYTALCRRLNEQVGPVLLLAPCEPDLAIMRQVQAALSLPLLGLQIPVRQAIDVVGNATVHVGGRWHSGIFAAAGGAPQVMLSANNHKVHSLARQLRMDAPVFDALTFETRIDEIVALAREQVEGGAALRASILARSRELAAQVDQNMDFVRQLAARLG